MSQFPQNPDDGDVAEVKPGLYYQYHKGANSWKRLDGFKNIAPATPTTPGLMTSGDFLKVEKILLPPFQTSLTSDQCNTTFTEGKVELVSTKEDLFIEHEIKVINKVGRDVVGDREKWVLFENTFGIDFRLNLDRLIEELEKRGRIKYRKTKGPQGDPGDPGDPGRDNLDTGPEGDPGDPGKNAPFNGVLINDNSAVSTGKTNRAVIDIKNDPDNPKRFIVTIANIGNPDACPDKVKWKNRNSPWLLATSEQQNVICPRPNTAACRICDTELFYIDSTTIRDQIAERYNLVINNIKAAKEAKVREWLDTLIKVFNSQKQAVCCAIEAIVSRNRNQEIRNTFSNARAQASQAGYAFSIASDADPKYPRSAVSTIPADFLEEVPVNSNVIINGDLTLNGYATFSCVDCYVQISLDRSNMGPDRSIAVELPPGHYAATVIKCCINYENVGSKGVFWVKSTVFDEDNQLVYREYTNPDKGALFEEEAPVRYTGDTVTFTHAGGPVYFFANLEFACKGSTGEIVLCVQPTRCLDNCKVPSTGSTAEEPLDLTCEMAATHLEFYERGWRIDECCGAHISISGTEWIIVYRSFRTDKSCGGGEYETTPCIAQFLDRLGHVAIAWPTADGVNFLGAPRGPDSVAQFMYDDEMSEKLLDQIKLGNVFSKKGDPESNITHIIVPMI